MKKKEKLKNIVNLGSSAITPSLAIDLNLAKSLVESRFAHQFGNPFGGPAGSVSCYYTGHETTGGCVSIVYNCTNYSNFYTYIGTVSNCSGKMELSWLRTS